MKATKKVENYTVELTAKVKADYAAGVSVDDIAKVAQKTPRSIIAKLSREGVYQKKEYTAKDGTKAESKASLVEKIAEKLGVAAEVVGSLESATKQALKLVFSAIPAEVPAKVPAEAGE